MLDTVLQIGRVLRQSPDGLRHHRYIKQAPQPDKRNPVEFWCVSVVSSGAFDFSKIARLNNENRQAQLFYLNYKSSDADSTKPYVFGDVYRSLTKSGDDGNFRFGDPSKKSWMALNSFQRGEEIDAIMTPLAQQFRRSFRHQLVDIEKFLRGHPNCYIHFDFDGQGWHELEEIDALNEKLLNGFFNNSIEGYVLKSFLFKTMTSNSTRLPGFVDEPRRLRVFPTANDALDLLYGVNYASKAVIRKGDIKIVVLPRGKNLTAKQIERFFDRASTVEPSDTQEEVERAIVIDNEDVQVEDELFGFLPTGGDSSNFVQFDFIFSKSGGTKSDVDLVEFSGIEHSRLTEISQRIRQIRNDIETLRADYFSQSNVSLNPLWVLQSFSNILGDTTSAQKKYQSHLLHVLPQIYTGTYYNDPVLLPALIQKTEFNIRNDKSNFNFLKFDFYFLSRLQNRFGEDVLMKIQSSQSYHLGYLLGKLAKQFSGPKSPIKSFEKNYVGQLSRRIGTLPDLIRLSNDIHQKLVFHIPTNWTFRTSTELAASIREFTGSYNRHECAFGFFESYFQPLPAKETEDNDNSSAGLHNDNTDNTEE